jgi:predicted methyltransferase
MKQTTGFILSLLIAVPILVQAQDNDIRARVEAAMASNIHNAEEKARYPMRQPADVLEFFRLEPGMRVIELLPFGGWYTKLLSQVINDNGKLYVTQPEVPRYSDQMRDMLALPGLEQVEEIDWGRAAPAGGSPWSASGRWDVEPVDMVLTFQNYHNFSYDDRMAINQSTFDVLKSGGYYGIEDHTRRHNEPSTRANGRRVDPVLVIKEVQDSGFVFVDYSDALYRADDALELEVGQPAVSGNTDRFVLLFRKP